MTASVVCSYIIAENFNKKIFVSILNQQHFFKSSLESSYFFVL